MDPGVDTRMVGRKASMPVIPSALREASSKGKKPALL
jgi:hypothetical protein